MWALLAVASSGMLHRSVVHVETLSVYAWSRLSPIGAPCLIHTPGSSSSSGDDSGVRLHLALSDGGVWLTFYKLHLSHVAAIITNKVSAQSLLSLLEAAEPCCWSCCVHWCFVVMYNMWIDSRHFIIQLVVCVLLHCLHSASTSTDRDINVVGGESVIRWQGRINYLSTR